MKNKLPTRPDGSTSDTPDPEIRKRMIDFAFSGSKLAQMAKKMNEAKTAEEQALRRLEELTITIFQTCAQVKRLDEQAGGAYDEHAMQALVLSMWRDALVNEGKENMHYLLSIVLTGEMLCKLDEVV